MTMTITVLDDLPDLALLEMFSYLSCAEILCAFTCLNDRLTALLTEQGVFHHVDLSSVRHRTFDTLLRMLPLNDIESLVIDSNASPLQLAQWPYLPRLTQLRLRGVREHNSITIFVLPHAATLTHLTIESNKYFLTDGVADKFSYSTSSLYPLVKNILLRHLPALRSLDLGFDINHYIFNWRITAVQVPLTYLRVTLHTVANLLRVLSTPSLSNTLHQLHTRIRGMFFDRTFRLSTTSISFRMAHLHTFTFVKPLFDQFNDEWSFIEALTSSSVMPVLRRAKLTIVVTVADLNRIDQSMLFTDHRRVDVHFAFILSNNDNLQHSRLDERIPRGSRSHPRQVVSATFVRTSWPDNERNCIPYVLYISDSQTRYHLWYTLPWAFNDFFQLSAPARCITEIQVFAPPRSTTTIGPSRLLRLNVESDVVPPILALPHMVSLNCIQELHLFSMNTSIPVTMPGLRHITFTDSFDALYDCFFISMNIRSITIAVHQSQAAFITGSWAALGALSYLPLLSSLRVVLYDMHGPPHDANCRIIAETAVLLADFSFCFRKFYGMLKLDTTETFNGYRTFIEKLRQWIAVLSLHQQPYEVVEKDGFGVMMWF